MQTWPSPVLSGKILANLKKLILTVTILELQDIVGSIARSSRMEVSYVVDGRSQIPEAEK